MHCNGKNTLGRYFPVSAKNLTDSTALSLQAHVASCTRCPEPIKASLAYLGHRSILQKAELSGSWKKAFFQKVWSRLHVERGWTAIDEDDGDAEQSSVDEDDQAHNGDEDNEEVNSKDEARETASDSEKEEVGESMNALIKAAAMWLTEQDAATDTTKGTGRGNRGAKRPAATASQSKKAAGLPTKRRRVHS
jgi:hypothetical protein